jgi:tetratricopeptide (TPR) repeat protein
MKRLVPVLALCLACAYAATLPVSAAGKKAAPTPAPSAAADQPTPAPSAEPLDKAIPRLQAKLKTDPNDRDSMQELAGDYLQANRPDLAYQLTQQLLKAGAKTSLILYMDGYALAQMGKPQDAVADLEQASNLDPTNGSVLTLLTNLYLQGGRLDDADRVAKRAATFNKTDARVFLNYGIVLATEKKFDDARTQFEAAFKLSPKDIEPLLYEARTYLDQNAAPLSLQVLDRALAVVPDNPDALLLKAQVYGSQHDVKNAVAIYEHLATLMTDDVDKVSVLDAEAHLYADEKQNDQADAQYRRAISLFPNVPDGHIAYGDYLMFVKQPQKAEAEWTTGLGPNRDNQIALARLGAYYAETNNLSKSVDQFQRLTQVNPNDASAFMSLGQVYGVSKQLDKARDAFRRAYDLSHAPAALAGVGQADFELHNYKEATDIFDALDQGATQFMQANPALYVVAGRVYAAAKDNAKAKTAYNKFLALVKPDSQAASEVKKLIADLDHPGSSAPAPAPRPSAKPTSAPAH